MDNIILIGMPGSGKSTVGVLLAKAFGYDFLDTDLVLQQQENALLQDILDQKGAEYFLKVEEKAICSVNCHRTVIAPGGIGHLKKLGPVVYLRVPVEELKKRITNMSTRGIAMDPGQTLADVMDFRAPLYEKYADLTIDVCSGQDLNTTTQEVFRLLNEYRSR